MGPKNKQPRHVVEMEKSGSGSDDPKMRFRLGFRVPEVKKRWIVYTGREEQQRVASFIMHSSLARSGR